MSDVMIQVEGLSKQYQIRGGQKTYDRFGEQLADMFISPFRRAGRLLRGQASGAAELDETFWALKDISFEINAGQVVGIIGHNGAGKSTLLKILSDITEPTGGYVDIYGRVGSLLEVGTGFHPELTGRENIYLNGAILGMKKSEIERKLDEIVAFAEIDKFIDTPVKHYSSGMYVRLAFAVAAHLEPDILVVDEVLAVGDVAFQKKCLGKMDDVSKEGRTVILVSHNMNAIQRLCPTSLLLNKGHLVARGDTTDIIAQYLSTDSRTDGPNSWIDLSAISRSGTGKAKFKALSYSSLNSKCQNQPFPNGPLEFLLDISSEVARDVGSVAVTLYDQYGSKLVNVDTRALGKTISLEKGHNKIKLRIEELHLNPGIYTLGLWLADPPSEVHDSISSAFRVEVVDFDSKRIRVQGDGLVTCDFQLLEAI